MSRLILSLIVSQCLTRPQSSSRDAHGGNRGHTLARHQGETVREKSGDESGSVLRLFAL